MERNKPVVTALTVKRARCFILALLAFLTFVSVADIALAATINVPADQPTIQAAIDAAFNGDTIIVADGTYTDAGNKDLDFGGKIITVKSENGAANCIIDCEAAGRGFYFHSGETNSAVVEGFTIRNGKETGAGIYCSNAGPTIKNCILKSNDFSGEIGGGIYMASSDAVIINCVIANNYGGSMIPVPQGGGVYVDGGSPTITNCTIVNNFAYFGYGGGIYCTGSATVTVNNSILWNNWDDAFPGELDQVEVDSGSVTLNNCDVDAGLTGAVTQNSCISQDPVFVDPGSTGTENYGNYHLQDTSPCIDTGNNAYVTEPTDLDGNARIVNATVDMGAYEVVVIRVPADQPTIQAAINAASNGHIVIVADGTYTGTSNRDLDFGGKIITVKSENGAANCIIDCEAAGRGFDFHSGETNSAVLDGFVVMNGNSFGDTAGIRISGASPVIKNCIIRSCTGAQQNPGIGLQLTNSSSQIINCIIANNYGQAAIGPNGAGVYVDGGSPTITNCTIVNNFANMGYGGGIYCTNSAVVTVNNTILWGNKHDFLTGTLNQVYVVSGSVTLNNCDVDAGLTGTVTQNSCISQDPVFVDPGSTGTGNYGDYHLQGTSPCIDVGDNSYVPGSVMTDLDGNARIANSTVDMGAYEVAVIRVPVDQPTIQAAINAASNGNTIIVADGTYTGAGNKDLDFAGKDITVKSANGASNCIIDCQNSGRGFYFHTGETSAAVVEGFTITNGNHASGGSAIYCAGSSPTIVNCVITNNSNNSLGGAIRCETSSSPTIVNCAIMDNSAGTMGGAICCSGAAPYSPTITNCTIANNSSTDYGGGICFNGSADATINNTIFWGNTATTSGNQLYCNAGTQVTLNYCDYANGGGDVGGTGTFTPNNCISIDPQFENAAGGDYHLQSGSQCIDTGDNSYVTESTDLDGNARIVNSTVDMGAYEYQGPPLGPVADFTADQTTGDAPLTVQFTDTSTGIYDSWSWDLDGDAVTDSSAQNPSYTYMLVGTYSVTLTIDGSDGDDTVTRVNYITVTDPGTVTADFTASPTTGDVPLDVVFSDFSVGNITSWEWDFENDGTLDSTQQNPFHTYNSANTYTVKLTATGPAGLDDEIKISYIVVTAPPNIPPVVSVVTPASPSSSPVTITYDLADGNGDNCTVTFEYSTNGGSTWDACTAFGGSNPQTGVAPGAGITFIWDAALDLPEGVIDAEVRVSADDGNGGSDSGTTSVFAVDTIVLLDPPTSFAGAGVAANQIEWTWTDAAGADSYQLEDLAGSPIAMIDPGVGQYIETVAGENTSVTRRLRSCKTTPTELTVIPPGTVNGAALPWSAGGYHAQYLYTAADLSNTAGNITRIYWQRLNSGAAANYTGVCVTLGHTTRTSLDASYAGNFNVDGSTQVRDPATYDAPATVLDMEWVEIPLDRTFYYNGTNNLVVDINVTAGSADMGWSEVATTGVYPTLYGSPGAPTGAPWDRKFFFKLEVETTGSTSAPVVASAYTLVRDATTADFSLALDGSQTQVIVTVTEPPNSHAGNTGVKIERAANDTFTMNATTLQGFTDSYLYTDTSVTPGNTYWYRITYCNGEGTASAPSAGESIVVPLLTDTPPVAQITDPTSGTYSADVTITYTLRDFDSDPADITVEYSTNGGSSWDLCTAGSGGDGTTSLTTSPAGISHTCVWDSAADAVGASGDQAVQVRITPSDKDGIGTQHTTSFTVNNAPQLPPSAAISSPTSGTHSGNVQVTYALADANNDPADIVAQYSTDGGSTWNSCTEGPGSDGTAALATSASGTAHTFVWASATDGVGASAFEAVQLKITPSDNDGTGTADTVSFTVNNQPAEPPSVLITSPASGTYSVNITISYTLTDTNSDPAGITVQYSTNGGSTWNSCTTGPGGDGATGLTSSPAGISHTYVWNSAADSVGTSADQAVQLRITPSDKDGTGTADTTSFTVNNVSEEPPGAAITDPTGGTLTGDVAISYTITDINSDPADISVQYSTNGGSTWNSCTEGPGSDGTAALAASVSGTAHTFVWASATDGAGASAAQSVLLKITPSDNDGTGTADTVSFTVDNTVQQPPRVILSTPSGVLSGNILIGYFLSDVESDTCTVVVQYSTDNGATYQVATMGSGGDGISGLESTPWGSLHIFDWAALSDGVGAAAPQSVLVRITPDDGQAQGVPAISSLFTVDNAVLRVNFSGSPVDGDVPLDVQFSDFSAGNITSWSWDFGDGGTSTQQSPLHEYTGAGSYTVTLTVAGPGGSDTMTRVRYISVAGHQVTKKSGGCTIDRTPTTLNDLLCHLVLVMLMGCAYLVVRRRTGTE